MPQRDRAGHTGQRKILLCKARDIRLADANNLYLYNTTLPVAKINRSFIEAGIDIQEAHLCKDTLEDYFKKITGGEGIA